MNLRFDPTNNSPKPESDSASNVYWDEQFPTISREILKGDEPPISVGPGCAQGIDSVEHLTVGGAVRGELERADGSVASVLGTIQGFVPAARTDQTISFRAQIRVAPEVPFEVTLNRTLFFPLEELTCVDE